MTADVNVLAARAAVVAARARLDASIDIAKQRLSPRSLAGDAVGSARDKAVEVAQTGVQAARDRPIATAAVVGAIGLALARKPVLGWLGWRDATRDADES
jgi:ElaB/YqjD/DUF883 family membrane-anchored ribosome-binding protein